MSPQPTKRYVLQHLCAGIGSFHHQTHRDTHVVEEIDSLHMHKFRSVFPPLLSLHQKALKKKKQIVAAHNKESTHDKNQIRTKDETTV